MAKRKFSIFSWLRSIINKVFKDKITDYTYADMEDAIDIWLRMYYDEPPWLNKTHGKSLNLPSTIAAEFARLIMVEFDVEITGSPRADFINRQFKRLTASLHTNLEKALAVGGFVFKPYVSSGIIMTDCVLQDEFIPTEFFDGVCVGGIFINKVTKGKHYYWQLEEQRYDISNKTHSSTSRFFVSASPDNIGKEIPVEEYPVAVQESFTIYGCDNPLFAFWKVPLANNIEKDSPLGVSVYSRAIKHIKEADKQWDRFLWEFEGGELAIDASEFALRQAPSFDVDGNEIRQEMPKTKDRLFRRLNARNKDNSAFYQVFAPTLRDGAISNGLNRIFRLIEWTVGLAYGTLSDPNNIDKTAEEIKASKQRSYVFVSNMQNSLQATLEQLIYAYNKITSVCHLAPEGSYSIKWNWGDGILEDVDKDTQIKLQEVNNGIISKTFYLMWRYSVTKDQAEEMIPKATEYQSFFE